MPLDENNYAVIVSGDGDFHCILEYLHRQKKLRKLIIPNRTKYSSLLRKFMPQIAFVSDLRSKLMQH